MQHHIDHSIEAMNRLLEDKEPYRIVVSGEEFIVLPNVFSPKYFNDTEFFVQHIPVHRGDHILEIGCGTGIISVMTALKGAGRVVAVDISPAAVENTRQNVALHHVEGVVEALHGSVYEPVGAEQFDCIFWNTPFTYGTDTSISIIERALIDPHYAGLRNFLLGARDHLRPGGKLLLGFSFELGNKKEFDRVLRETGYRAEVYRSVEKIQTKLSGAAPLTYVIFELHKI